MYRHLTWCLAIVCALAPPANADEPPWTLQRVVDAARTRAPATVIARAQTDEARALMVGARRLATRNPAITTELGPRWSDGTSTDARASVSMPLDLGGRRASRTAVAEAEITYSQLGADATERRAIATAVTAYYQVLYAERRIALAEERVRLAESAEKTAAQRLRAGDVAEFEVKLARGEIARARSLVAAVTSERLRARAQLAAALGVPLGEVPVTGDLADRSRLEGRTTTLAQRPDLRLLAQEAKLAEAEAKLARTERWPTMDLRLTIEHERDADMLLGAVTFSLPVFDRGQGEAARAAARAKRAQTELTAKTNVAGVQVSAANDSYAATVTAVRLIEEQALPLALENETAAGASYRSGKIDLGTLLLIRREALDTRREHLDRLLEAALAAVELWTASGAPL
jgi:cobalt-zinc-cadmium efflux system outer membrane protein